MSPGFCRLWPKGTGMSLGFCTHTPKFLDLGSSGADDGTHEGLGNEDLALHHRTWLPVLDHLREGRVWVCRAVTRQSLPAISLPF